MDPKQAGCRLTRRGFLAGLDAADAAEHLRSAAEPTPAEPLRPNTNQD